MGQMDKTPLFGLGISIACMVVSAIVVKQYFSKMPTGCAFVTQPGLVGLLLGALPEMWKYILRYEAHSGLAEYHEQEGDTLYFDFGLLRYFMPAVVITRDPRNVKYMLKTKFDSFVKGVTFHTIGLDLLGDGIFNVDGDLWFKQRKTASQMFTANRFKQHIWKVVRKNCDKVISLLRASQEPTVDIFNVLNRFTLDSIGEIGFGTDIGSLENPNRHSWVLSMQHRGSCSFASCFLVGVSCMQGSHCPFCSLPEGQPQTLVADTPEELWDTVMWLRGL